MFKHPNYYKELRKRNKLAESRQPVVGGQQTDQAISEEATDGFDTSVRPGPGLKQRDSTGGVPGEADISVTSDKRQAASSKPQASSTKRVKHQATSIKPQATSVKLQAASYKLQDS